MSAFWKDFMYPSVIDDILKRPDFTLEDILSEDEAPQDARNNNQALIEYLSNPEIVEKLLDYVLIEAPKDADEKTRFKYPTIAGEILMAEITQIDILLYNDKEKYLSRLFDYFNTSVNGFHGPLVGKIITALLLGNPKETVDYITTRENFLETFTGHLTNPSIIDFFLRFITLEEGYADESNTYLIENNFASILINKFSPENSKLYADATLFINELIVTIGSESPLFGQFIQKENIETLFNHMLNKNNTSALVDALNVVISFIYTLSDNLAFNGPNELISLIIQNLDQFKCILLPENNAPERLGFGRIKIIEMYEAVLQLNMDDVVNSVKVKSFLSAIVQLFFQYEQHSILHKTFYRIISMILDKPLFGLLDELINNLKFHHKIVEYYVLTTEKEKNGAPRTSCIAHCILIGKYILETYELNETLRSYLSNDEVWNDFVETKLNLIIEEDNKPLGDRYPTIITQFFEETEYDDDDDDNDEDNKDDNDENNSDSDQSEGSDEDLDVDDLSLKDDEDFSCENDHKDYDISRSEVLITKQNIALYLEY